MRLRKLALLVLVAGCAASQTQVRETREEKPVALATSAAPEGKLICRMERPTGSHIAERICRYEEEVERNRARTQEMLLTAPHTAECKSTSCPSQGDPR